MKNKTNVITCVLVSTILLVGFWSSFYPLRAYALLTASSFTVTTYDLRGSTYNSDTNSWYFASPNNNTMIRLPNNTTTPTSMPVNGNTNCADPEDILSLKFAGEQYIALWCDNGAVATHGLMIRDAITNAERDFESNIFNTEDGFIMVESETLDKMYVVNHGAGSSPQIAMFNLQAINSTMQAMFIGSIGFNGQCGTVYSAVINDEANEMYVTCSRVTTTANTLVIVDLEVSSAVTFITLTGTAGTLTIDYNSQTDTAVVADYTANDLWLVDMALNSLEYTNTSICPSGGGLSPQFNENVNQIYLMCNVSGTGVNTILLFDVTSESVVTSFSAGSSVSGVQGGGSYWIQQHFEDSIGRLYATFGWTQNGGSGAVSNTITTIHDDSSIPEENPSGGNAVNGRCGVGTVLDCIGDRSVGLAITGGQDITVVSGDLFCGIGLNATCSGDIKENGTGLLLMLITGTFFAGALIASIATANSKFGAGISFTEIPKEFWLFLVVGVVAFSFYMQWIPDIVFYGLVVGLAGLFAFGLYRHIRG